MHFLEMDSPLLIALSKGYLLQVGFEILSENDKQQLVASKSCLTQISKFFRQLSEDNRHVNSFLLEEKRENFVKQFVNLINNENSEFVNTLAVMLFNVCESEGLQSLLQN